MPAAAFCGFYAGKADANLFNQASQVVLVRDGQRTVRTMQNDYQGPLNAFVLVVPTPTLLHKGQVRIADKAVFERLDAYSSPRMVEYPDTDPCDTRLAWGLDAHYPAPNEDALAVAANANAMGSGKALGVTVESRYSLGEYDIVNLSATQSDGLEAWLLQNGYRIPEGTAAALKPYVRQGMKFFVAKVNLQAQARTGFARLRPLQFAFETEEFMLPLRLGMLNAPPDKTQDLIVYALTSIGRVESSNYRTLKLPSNVDLPFFVKPQFGAFYKDMFERQLQRAQQRAVFTEYVWDVTRCDPCAADPLSRSELLRAGVFWLDGNPDAGFAALRNADRRLAAAGKWAASAHRADPVLLTRLHVRYSASTFAEDLMFIQTGDRDNWQARYVLKQPYASSVPACSGQMAQLDCQALCTQRVNAVLEPGRRDLLKEEYSGKSRAMLLAECVPACSASKKTALNGATRYYAQDLPNRLRTEKQTLADLAGWSMDRIEAMPGADKVWGHDMPSSSTPQAVLSPRGSKR
ncbi:MAG: DUF2330 domain-containing protein [Rhodoferax sp.]|nr:DUF2330 domain-containing protein [Rhodoferax sp.]